jgi:RNA-directed DNA polymerase
MLQQWLKAGYIEKDRLFPTHAGVPQGGVISPAITNMTLDGLQQVIEAIPGRRRYRLIRYVDDFVVIGDSREGLEQDVMPVVKAFLIERGLELSSDKTRITHIHTSFDFLGQNIRKYKNKLLIKPSRKNLRTFLNNIQETVKTLCQAKTAELIGVLNPKILGWANYHRHIVAKKTFSLVDHTIFQMLYRWSKRRHPGKSIKWIRHKYFRRLAMRDWVFSAEIRDKSGKKRLKTLRLAMDVKIQRHIKIRKKAHPFDPEYRTYFKQRRLTKGLSASSSEACEQA